MKLTNLAKILLALMAVSLASFTACSTDATPGECIEAAEAAGVPDRVIDWMKQPPGDLGAIERIAIREALEKFGLGEACASLQDATDGASFQMPQQPNTPVPASMPTPTSQPAAQGIRPSNTPLPAPTALPASTAMPAPTTASKESTDRSLWPEIPEVVYVTFSGTAGERSSRFIVHFDEPVVAVAPPGSTDDDPNSSSGIKLVVEYPGDGSSHYIPLRTRTSLTRPSNELSFGPIAEEFALARGISLQNDTSILDVDGNRAVIGLMNVVFVNPEYLADIADPVLANCAAFMELSGYSPIIVRNVKNLQRASLTDKDRIEWRSLLGVDLNFDELHRSLNRPCVGLWSEAITEENAHKRNWNIRTHCMNDSPGDNFTQYDKDVIELLNQTYTKLGAADRVTLRFLLDDRDACSYFYPQLYYGRWIPME